MIVCTKKCYDKFSAEFTKKLTWKTDGKHGTKDPNNSERLLLEWLLVPGNYALKWQGKDNSGMTKGKISEHIATCINKAGVLEKRNAKQVQSKIEHLETQFCRASDFANGQTGAGLIETDQAGFDNAILDRCPLYFDILPKMGDRAMARPKATNMDNLDSSSESSAEQRKPAAKVQGKSNRLPSVLPSVIEIDDATNYNKNSSNALLIAHKPDDSLSLSPRKPKPFKGFEFEHADHMVAVSESKASLYKTKENMLRKEIAQKEFATEESKLALEQKKIELHLYKVLQIDNIMIKNPTWTADKIKKVYPDLADLVDSIYSD
jgi:hypothetical protein